MRSRRRHIRRRKEVVAAGSLGCIGFVEGRSFDCIGLVAAGHSLDLVEECCIAAMGSRRLEEGREGAVGGLRRGAVDRKAVAGRMAVEVGSLVDIALEVGRSLLAAGLCKECSQRSGCSYRALRGSNSHPPPPYEGLP